MELYIEIKDGQPVGHPYFADNLRECFGDAIPEKYVPFHRIPRPDSTDPYIQVTGPVYVMDNGIVRDEWTVRQMTAEERQAKIDEVKKYPPFPSWVFNETRCEFMPPVDYPSDGEMYFWNEESVSWVKVS